MYIQIKFDFIPRIPPRSTPTQIETITSIKQNPFRFPKHSSSKFVFKVKVSINSNYSRLMYAIFHPNAEDITVLGIFERKAGYKDFEKAFDFLKK